jgi:hypothetical protein
MSQFLSAWEEYAQSVTDAPLDFLHSAGLMALSAISLGRRWIERGVNGVHPNLFLMLVAGSSRDRKSYCVSDLGMTVIRSVEQRRIGPEDFSPEALVTALLPEDGKSRNRMVIAQPEFGEYLARSTRQYGSMASATLCKLYDGQTFPYKRAKGAMVTVKNPRVSFFGSVAFGMLAKYGDPADWDTGFYARFLWVIASQRRPRSEIVPPANPDGFARASAALRDLRDRLKASKRPLEISKEATDLVKAFGESIPEEELNPALSACRERLLNIVLKLALIYQIDLDHNAKIGKEAMEKAIAFAQRSWSAAQIAYTESTDSQLGKNTNRIWKALWDSPEQRLARRDIYRKLHLSAPDFNAAIDVLLKLGVVMRCGVSVEGTTKPIVGFKALEPYPDVQRR